MHYAQLFRKLREQKGLSHDALAKLARRHRNTVVNVEGGRRVKFATMAALMAKMGYPSNSPEMASLALLWLESVSGLELADPAKLNQAQQKLAGYGKSTGLAIQQLAETTRRNRLTERQVRLLIFAAEHPEVLAIVESVQDLLTGKGTDHVSQLSAAEDR